MEPYLTSDEVAGCAEQLQRMALDELEEFGLTREDLEDMTDMISQDFLGMGAGLMKVEHLTEPSLAESLAAAQEAFEEAALSEGADEATGEGEPALALPDAAKRSEKKQGITGALAHAAEEAGVRVSSSIERITYADLAGYDDVVKVMRDFGVGMQQDEEFQDLVGLLDARHGLDRMPAADTLLFRSPAREDANRFMVATLGQLGLPAIKMRMEENLAGHAGAVRHGAGRQRAQAERVAQRVSGTRRAHARGHRPVGLAFGRSGRSIWAASCSRSFRAARARPSTSSARRWTTPTCTCWCPQPRRERSTRSSSTFWSRCPSWTSTIPRPKSAWASGSRDRRASIRPCAA